jgi:hypothetical protein
MVSGANFEIAIRKRFPTAALPASGYEGVSHPRHQKSELRVQKSEKQLTSDF